MSTSVAAGLVLVLALFAANLPFLNERLFAIGPQREVKSLAWRALELAVFAALTLGVGFALESHIGQRQPQKWEFYAAFAFLFLTLAFPGFVWRYLRRRRG